MKRKRNKLSGGASLGVQRMRSAFIVRESSRLQTSQRQACAFFTKKLNNIEQHEYSLQRHHEPRHLSFSSSASASVKFSTASSMRFTESANCSASISVSQVLALCDSACSTFSSKVRLAAAARIDDDPSPWFAQRARA